MKDKSGLSGLLNDITGLKWVNQLIRSVNGNYKTIKLKHLTGSLKSITTAALWQETGLPLFIIAENEDVAEEWLHDLKVFIPNSKIAFLVKPRRFMRFSAENPEEHYAWLVEGISSVMENADMVCIATPDILNILTPLPEQINDNKTVISKGETYTFVDFVNNMLLNGFERREYVAEQGDIAVRGGIIDIFPIGCDNPLRIEFWGDIIDSIREFNCLSQRSIREHTEIGFISKLYHGSNTEYVSTVFDFLKNNTIVLLDTPEALDISDENSLKLLNFKQLHFNCLGTVDIEVESISQPAFNSSMKEFSKKIISLTEYKSKIFLCADGKGQLTRFRELTESALGFGDEFDEKPFHQLSDEILNSISWSADTLSNGFILPLNSLALFTEHEVFGRLRTHERVRDKRSGGFTLKELKDLNVGDYVVHEDRGVGKFAGFETVKHGESLHDCMKIIFADNDILFVHFNYINKVQKFSAQEGTIPKLSKLGSNEWSKKKSRAKKKLKDIARDLIKLYSERKAQPGYGFPVDGIWQKEFEASFIYEDTPDQATTSLEVKKDMESPTPMDRLVCGDVGFGKTEIAVRAAFKAAQAGKQTAVLVPTTILAQQHYMTFTDRLHRYPVVVDSLSRFKTKAEQKIILEKLEKGAIDILIGTHRILSKDIQFKDLGLLVIDEEHRFGVGAKEKLRQMRVSVDTLTLTATPIPRTLNFSLMGARDLSNIETPPRNRLPVSTEILEWNEQVLREGILRELDRGGQIFFVNDKISNLDKIASDLKMLIPGLKVGVAHGQLPTDTLEKTMERFIQKKYDVLLTTKIVESGLDIPNANTMFINRSDHFGLAELYQLRGRVGRTNIQAFCYLLIPPVKTISRKALQRLQAIEEFTDLGSGFQLALRDMEIRGAGDLLGPEQSGYIEEIGFDLYQKILDEAVTELRQEEFGELFKDYKKDEIRSLENPDLAIELDTDAFLPESYVKNETDRFMLYKKLYTIRTNAELKEITDELQDRFGKLPPEAKELIYAVKVRISALSTGFTKITIKPTRMVAEFPSQENEIFYKDAFPYIAEFISTLPDCKLKQVKDKLFFEALISSRDRAVELIWKIKKHLELCLTE